MTEQIPDLKRTAPGTRPGPHEASLRLRLGPVKLRSRVSITSGGLLAVAGLVSSILLSTAAVVMVATRKLPDDTLPRDL